MYRLYEPFKNHRFKKNRKDGFAYSDYSDTGAWSIHTLVKSNSSWHFRVKVGWTSNRQFDSTVGILHLPTIWYFRSDVHWFCKRFTYIFNRGHLIEKHSNSYCGLIIFTLAQQCFVYFQERKFISICFIWVILLPGSTGTRAASQIFFSVSVGWYS